MPIVIKEVIVKTTVERTVPQYSQSIDSQVIDRVKQQVLAELSGTEPTLSKGRKYKKDR